MVDSVDPDRVRVIAAAARIPIGAESPVRIARAVTPTVARFAAEGIVLPFETEPSNYVVVQRREIGR